MHPLHIKRRLLNFGFRGNFHVSIEDEKNMKLDDCSTVEQPWKHSNLSWPGRMILVPRRYLDPRQAMGYLLRRDLNSVRYPYID